MSKGANNYLHLAIHYLPFTIHHSPAHFGSHAPVQLGAEDLVEGSLREGDQFDGVSGFPDGDSVPGFEVDGDLTVHRQDRLIVGRLDSNLQGLGVRKHHRALGNGVGADGVGNNSLHLGTQYRTSGGEGVGGRTGRG